MPLFLSAAGCSVRPGRQESVETSASVSSGSRFAGSTSSTFLFCLPTASALERVGDRGRAQSRRGRTTARGWRASRSSGSTCRDAVARNHRRAVQTPSDRVLAARNSVRQDQHAAMGPHARGCRLSSRPRRLAWARALDGGLALVRRGGVARPRRGARRAGGARPSGWARRSHGDLLRGRHGSRVGRQGLARFGSRRRGSISSLRAVVPGYAPLPLPASFVNGAIDMAGREGGFDPDDASPVEAMARTGAPVLPIHGEDDGKIPAWHSRRSSRREGFRPSLSWCLAQDIGPLRPIPSSTLARPRGFCGISRPSSMARPCHCSYR